MCFSPDYNNVLFASALDGWAFGYRDDIYSFISKYLFFFINRIHHFADLYAKKLSIKRETLMKTLWGDFYFDKKTKRVYKGAQVR
jgi:ribosome assembly protein 1